MIKHLALAALLSTTLLQAKEPHAETWQQLSIECQNVGYRIHMMGVDAGTPDPKTFQNALTEIDKNLDLLVSNGVLIRQQFQLKPELDIEESVVKSVRKLIQKHQAEYGIYVIREMLDIGTRHFLSEYNEDAPLILNVRLPADFLKEFKAVIEKSGYEK